MNDAKAVRGSKLDRHEQIGKGTMGLEPFRRLLNDPRFATPPSSPRLLSTPQATRNAM